MAQVRKSEYTELETRQEVLEFLVQNPEWVLIDRSSLDSFLCTLEPYDDGPGIYGTSENDDTIIGSETEESLSESGISDQELETYPVLVKHYLIVDEELSKVVAHKDNILANKNSLTITYTNQPEEKFTL